jgi:hypothetical protein
MLANFLEKSRPINFIVYLVFFISFFLMALVFNVFSEEFTWYKVFESVSYFLIFILIFTFYKILVSKNKLTFDHSYALFLFLLTIISLISKLLDFKTLLLLLIYLHFLRKVYCLRKTKKIIESVFESGFWLGILYILEPYSVLFFVIIYTSILLNKKASFRTIVIPFIGFVTPLFIYFTYLFYIDAVNEFTQLFYLDTINNIFFYANDYTIVVFGVLLTLTMAAVFLKSTEVLSVNNSFKKSWFLLIINAIVALFYTLIITEKNGSEIVFLLVPSSIIIANGFEIIEKKLIINILFSLLLVLSIYTFFVL